MNFFFHALSTGDNKSSLNKFFWIYIYIFMSYFGYLLYLDWICHHQLTEHEKTSGFKKRQVSSSFLKEDIGI